jgi:hypothetical protein
MSLGSILAEEMLEGRHPLGRGLVGGAMDRMMLGVVEEPMVVIVMIISVKGKNILQR